MPSYLQPIAKPVNLMRSLAVAGLMGATTLTSLPTMAQPQAAGAAAIEPAQAASPRTHAAAGATKMKGESVERRIENLHAALKITPDEESNWTGVAQAMRDNSTAMQNLAAEKAVNNPKTLTALDDLKTYEQFARAHVDGLQNLTTSFEKLYTSMPDPQKKIADDVFNNFDRKHVRLRS